MPLISLKNRSFRLAKEGEQPEFIERVREETSSLKTDVVKASASVKPPEPKRAVQAVLPLEEKSVGKREGFSWDESKGIE